MDVLDKLKEKNDKHRESIEEENKEIWSFGIHSCFFMFLLYYEYFSKNGDAVIPGIISFIFFYAIYDIIISIFCKVIFKSFTLESLALIALHSTFTYYWIWHQDTQGLGFILGLILFLSLIISCLKTTSNKNIWSVCIHFSFILCLVYYEVFSKEGEALTFEYISTLFFVYILYNFIVFFFCTVIFTNFVFTCLSLVVFHSTFIYYWIWHQEKHGVAFLLGFMFIVSLMVFGFKVRYYKYKE